MKPPRSLFRLTLLRIMAGVLLLETLVGFTAYRLLMVPVLQHHTQNFASDILQSSQQTLPGTTRLQQAPADGGSSWLPFNVMLGRELSRLSSEKIEVRKVAGQDNHFWFALPTPDANYVEFDHRQIVGTMPVQAFLSWMITALLAPLAIAIWLAKRLTTPISNLRNHVLRHDNDLSGIPATGIIELNELQQEFTELTSRLASALNDRTSLLLGLSHELSAPVTRLTMAIELYAEKIDADKRTDMQHDLEEMRRIISQFLTAARCLGPGEQENGSLRELLQLLQQRYAVFSRIKFSDLHPAWDSRLNTAALERILVNLIDNALRHAEQSDITVALQHQERGWMLSVSDNGPGIADGDMAALFQPFEKRGPGQGVGLGLALSKLLAEQQGWQLQLANRIGGGLSATLAIPPP